MSNDVARAFIFADLSGYTALTETHGDADAARIASRFVELAREALEADAGARLVKSAGDGVMLVATDAGSALRVARALWRAVDSEPDFPRVRIGVHAGTAVEVEADFFGATVNLCSRLANQAEPGEILCSELVARAASALEACAFESRGPVQLKNIREPVPVFAVRYVEHALPSGTVDPVCRMRVDPSRAVRRRYAGCEIYFCSERCASEFDATPGDFVKA